MLITCLEKEICLIYDISLRIFFFEKGILIISFEIDSNHRRGFRPIQMPFSLNSVKNCFLQKISPLGQATDAFFCTEELVLRALPYHLLLQSSSGCLPGCWLPLLASAGAVRHPPNPASPLQTSEFRCKQSGSTRSPDAFQIPWTVRLLKSCRIIPRCALVPTGFGGVSTSVKDASYSDS